MIEQTAWIFITANLLILVVISLLNIRRDTQILNDIAKILIVQLLISSSLALTEHNIILIVACLLSFVPIAITLLLVIVFLRLCVRDLISNEHKENEQCKTQASMY